MRRDETWDEAEWTALETALRGVEAPEPPPGLEARCQPRHGVLVVDDEPNLRRLVQVPNSSPYVRHGRLQVY